MATAHTRVPAEGRRQQIIDVATALFARQGFNGTTTRQIAQRAAVNEAIIFRHFPTKEDLYWAVIENQCTNRSSKLESRLAGDGDPVETLVGIADDFFRRDTTLTRLLLFTALEKHELSDRFYRTHVARYFELLSDFVRRNIERGLFRPVDPLLAARSFVGMLYYHFHVQEVYGGKKYQQFDPADVTRGLVDIWMRGVQACPGEKRAPAGNGPSSESSHRNA